MTSTSNAPSKSYLKRKVAAPKPCSICFKPTTTCMYNPNIYQGIADWFYCCDIHLEDNPSFMNPLYDTSYHTILEEANTVDAKLQKTQEELKSCGSWDTWLNGFLNKKKTSSIEPEPALKTENKDQKNESSKEEGKSEETLKSKKEQQKQKINKSAEETLKTKLSELAEQKKILTNKLFQIKQNTKKFEINDVMYRSKIMTIQQKMKKQKELKTQEEVYTRTDPTELMTKFPTLPKNNDL